MMNRAEWGNGLLARLPCYRQVAFRAVQIWMCAESGGRKCDGVDGAEWNPLNTTLPWPNQRAKDYNSVGVKNYPTYVDGVQATLCTLLRPMYDGIRLALVDPAARLDDIIAAIAASPWGTGAESLNSWKAAYLGNMSHYIGLPIGE